MTRRVVIVQETLPDYRVPLLAQVQRRAAERGIAVEVVHGKAPGDRGTRLNTGVLPGATVIRNRYLRAPGENGVVVWQPALSRCVRADLVIVEQANRLLLNYALLLAQRARGPKVAFWGHGRNLQARPGSWSERAKARVARWPSWWFAYTGGVAAHLESCGVPLDRVTVVGNTINVIALRDAVDRSRRSNPPAALRCAYVGGLHPHKRLDLLFAAADLLATMVPGFELVVAGDGEQRTAVEHFVRDRSWASYRGHVSGDAHAEVLATARLLLVPGLAGLVVLDSFAAGVPLVTTADALHSPEIEYVTDGENGVVVPGPADASVYADVVTRLLRDQTRWDHLSRGALRSADRHTIEAAAARIVQGIELALEPRRDPRS